MTRPLTVLGSTGPTAAPPAAAPCGGCPPGTGAGTEQSPQHARLEAEGWVRRFAAAPPRLEEMSALYRELGLAVLHEPLDEGGYAGDCAGCAPARSGWRVIYTRNQP